MADGHETGIVISRAWLALAGTVVAVAMAAGSWAMSQSTSKSTTELQLVNLERRLESLDTRGEARRTSMDATWRDYDARLSALSDRIARIEARLDSAAGLEPRRSRTGLECWQGGLPADPAILRWTRP
jgi:Skp family chaperone for outer membrane proteins